MDGRARVVLSVALGLASCREEAPAPQPAAPAAALATNAPDPEPTGPPVRKDGTVLGESRQMGTRVTVNIWVDPGRTAAQAGAAIEAATAEIERLEDLLSEWRPQSELSRFNGRAGEVVKLGPELFEMLRRSKAISARTHGRFDVTFHSVGQLWRFEPGATPPSPEAIAEKLPLVDYTAIEIDEGARTGRLAKAGMMVGLGAIAKGYAVDRASAVLLEHGFTNHIVEAGGDTRVSGTKNGKDWMVGVQDPDGKRPVGVIPSRGGAIVTSGDYQRFFVHEGKSYAHILDPATGWPIERERSPRSVTLLAANATEADAYCTAVTVMGPVEGMKFVEAAQELETVIITRDGDVLVSSGLRGRFVDTRGPAKTKGQDPG